MKVLGGTRETIYPLLAKSFARAGIKPWIVELGVLRGDNVERIRAVLAPELAVLVDSWSVSAMDDYRKINGHREWVESLEVHSAYFGGNPYRPETHHANYQAVLTRFRDAADVKILRMDTRTASVEVKKLSGGRGFDLIYIDANHQYEAVLDDLLTYGGLLSEHGFLMLNDCCHSQSGMKQNLGVLEAVCKFIKISGFLPILLTNTDFSDLVLAPPGSLMIDHLNWALAQSMVGYVEVPSHLLANARVLSGQGQMSFV